MPTEPLDHDHHEHDVKRQKPQPPEQTAQGLDGLTQTAVDPSVALRRAMAAPPPAIKPGDILSLQRAAGNRALQRLIAQRKQMGTSSKPILQPKRTINPPNDVYEQEADRVADAVTRGVLSQVQRQAEEQVVETKRDEGVVAQALQKQGEQEGIQTKPLTQREGEDEEKFEGPRMKPRASPHSSEGRRSTTTRRRGAEVFGSSAATGIIGDAIDLDGKALYGWDRPMFATDVATVVNNLVTNQASTAKGKTIGIYSGTHGGDKGNLYNIGAAGFVGEDQATANTAMANNPGTKIEVIDVTTSKTKDQLTSVFGMTNYTRILAWCHSKRSYDNSETLKSNWWPAPDYKKAPQESSSPSQSNQ